MVIVSACRKCFIAENEASYYIWKAQLLVSTVMDAYCEHLNARNVRSSHGHRLSTRAVREHEDLEYI